jgi:hypothetical protein
MKESGVMTKSMAKALTYTLKELDMKESGKMERRVVREFISMLMVISKWYFSLENCEFHIWKRFHLFFPLRYVGDWKEGKADGEGIYYYADGDKYDGKWKDDLKHGYGVYAYSNGDSYEGEWQEDAKHGRVS